VVLIPVAGDNKDPLVVLIAGSIGTRWRFLVAGSIGTRWRFLVAGSIGTRWRFLVAGSIGTRWRFRLQKVLIPEAGMLSQTTPQPLFKRCVKKVNAAENIKGDVA